ncbi:MAG: VOC family protein [Anaerolineae bacterium]|nr:VOC family protein [Anaerolineae bacterium]
MESLHHASIMASDLERAKRFYCDLLGLEPLPRPPRGVPGLWLKAGDAQVHVLVGNVDTVPLTDERRALEGSGLAGHFALRVADVQRARVRLAEAGYPPLGDVVERPDGSRSIFVRDPDGNLVEFIQADS